MIQRAVAIKITLNSLKQNEIVSSTPLSHVILCEKNTEITDTQLEFFLLVL